MEKKDPLKSRTCNYVDHSTSKKKKIRARKKEKKNVNKVRNRWMCLIARIGAETNHFFFFFFL